MPLFAGVITAMVTPFGEDGGVDLPGCRRLARHLLENGSDGLVLSGTTGESPTLDDDEKLAILGAVREELGPETQLIVGSGSNDTRHSVELTRRVTAAGADAVLVVTPYYNKPNPAGIRAHFEACAEATELPLVIYNIPSRCVVNIPPHDLAELAKIDNVSAVKQAHDADLGPIDGLEVLAGNDNALLRCLQGGGTGGILVASHLVGGQMREICDAAEAGDLDRARALDDDLQPLYEDLSVTSNPIPVKTALAMLGLCSERMRLPMVPASDEQRQMIRAALDRHGLTAVA
ncbi:MAG: 4-hydroxy-tetrahydrodipicolinate synthase [Thermoleophilia bacterium]|nr:4-hydroxy-tetrahydrodipicolinate synthase [Thermoleophilia bacterium]